jgi:hypothetical protein
MLMIMRSLGLLFALSAVIAATFSDSVWSFVRWFMLSAAAQIICYNVYRQIVLLIVKKIANDKLKEYSKQGVEVICPCARAVKNLIPIQLNTDNSYKCLDCNKNVTVKVDVQTFIETQPIDIDKSTAALDQVYTAVTQLSTNGDQIN